MKIPAEQFSLPNDHFLTEDDANIQFVDTPAFDVKDMEGNTLKVGDKVAVAVLSYKSAHLRVVTIKSFIEIPMAMYHRNDYWNKGAHMATNVVRYKIKFKDGKFTRGGHNVVKVA